MPANLLDSITKSIKTSRPTLAVRKSLSRLRPKGSTTETPLPVLCSMACPTWSGQYYELPLYLRQLRASAELFATYSTPTADSERQYVAQLVLRLPAGVRNSMLDLVGQPGFAIPSVLKFLEMLLLVLPENLGELIRASVPEPGAAG